MFPMQLPIPHQVQIPNHQQIQCMVGITAQPQQQLQFHNMRLPMIYHGLQMHKQTLYIIPIARLPHPALLQEV